MRENFIVSADKNNGYPTFSDAYEFTGSDFCRSKSIFISDGKLYPEYMDKNIESESFRHYSKNIFFVLHGVNDGYPSMLFWYGLKQKIISQIYSGNNHVEIIYYRDMPVRALYFRGKMIYKFGFSE